MGWKKVTTESKKKTKKQNGRNYDDGNVSKHVEDEKTTLMRGIWTVQCLNAVYVCYMYTTMITILLYMRYEVWAMSKCRDEQKNVRRK